MISLTCIFGDSASLVPEEPVIGLSAEDETDVAHLREQRLLFPTWACPRPFVLPHTELVTAA